MSHRLILKVTKFQLPPPKRLGTVVKNILGGHHPPPPMSNRVKAIGDILPESEVTGSFDIGKRPTKIKRSAYKV